MTFPRGRRARGCGPCSPDTASVAGLVPAPVTAAAARDAPRGPEAPRSLPCVRPEAPRPGRSLLSSPPAPGAPAARGRCGPGDAPAPRPETRPPRARTAFPSRTMPVTPPAGWGPACSSSAPGAEPAPPPARVTSVLRSPARRGGSVLPPAGCPRPGSAPASAGQTAPARLAGCVRPARRRLRAPALGTFSRGADLCSGDGKGPWCPFTMRRRGQIFRPVAAA